MKTAQRKTSQGKTTQGKTTQGKTTQGKKKNFTNTIYHVFWCMLLASAVFAAAMHLERHKSYVAEKNELSIQIQIQEATNETLRRELEYYGTDAYVERVAGERLGLVKPDEIVFFNVQN